MYILPTEDRRSVFLPCLLAGVVMGALLMAFESPERTLSLLKGALSLFFFGVGVVWALTLLLLVVALASTVVRGLRRGSL